MPKSCKSDSTEKQSAEPAKKVSNKTGVTRSNAEQRAWAIANNAHCGGKIGSGRKVPSGPVGGLGRKTNLSRSS